MLLEEQRRTNALLERIAESGGRRAGDVSSSSNGLVEIIVDRTGTFRRETHPKLFVVVDLLEADRAKRSLSVRDLAAETGVSKSWCAVAKRFWQGRGS